MLLLRKRGRRALRNLMHNLPGYEPEPSMWERVRERATEEPARDLALMAGGATLGAALMYLLDPERGRRRRALLRDQAVHLAHETEDFADEAARDLGHRSYGVVAGLRSGSLARGVNRPEYLQANWSPGARLLASLAGGALAVYGLGRRDALGGALGALGAAIVARAATNKPVRRMVGVGAGRRAIDVHKAINVNAPVEQVYDYWNNFENFPRFMSNLREVRRLGNDQSHWVAEGPANTPVEWDAIVTQRIPNQLLAWKSLPGSTVANAGRVRFDRNPDGSTRVTVQMSYNPPAGAAGHAVARLLGDDPLTMMHEDLARFKSLIETGKTTAGDETVRREDVSH
jgi:uncharacterized membrane protein